MDKISTWSSSDLVDRCQVIWKTIDHIYYLIKLNGCGSLHCFTQVFHVFSAEKHFNLGQHWQNPIIIKFSDHEYSGTWELKLDLRSQSEIWILERRTVRPRSPVWTIVIQTLAGSNPEVN